ncbi:MAG TPA: hypothetical protein VLL82_17015 [Mycobacterium sp.]|jgi:hypothetical protein|nr:hypothetical protein [Mycobacterium sp.]
MSLKWVPAGSSRDMSYVLDGYQYVIHGDPKGCTLVQKTAGGDTSRHQACATKEEAFALAESWAAEATGG